MQNYYYCRTDLYMCVCMCVFFWNRFMLCCVCVYIHNQVCVCFTRTQMYTEWGSQIWVKYHFLRDLLAPCFSQPKVLLIFTSLLYPCSPQANSSHDGRLFGRSLWPHQSLFRLSIPPHQRKNLYRGLTRPICLCTCMLGGGGQCSTYYVFTYV